MQPVPLPTAIADHTPDEPLDVCAPGRHWRADLRLGFARRGAKTALVGSHHLGPLRVQRPFYPESDGCSHVYLLHPPGGLVVGDALSIEARVASGDALLTTPSAGKLYGVRGSSDKQCQVIRLAIDDGACLEWLPQETIVFDGANGELFTRVSLSGAARVCGWDIVCLGRPAAGEGFGSGQCVQRLEILRDDRPVLLERNHFIGGSKMLDAAWGMRGCHTTGTLFATVSLNRETVDGLVDRLDRIAANAFWGLSQRGDIFLARYLGYSAAQCRDGFEQIWDTLRQTMSGKGAVTPRIWKT